ncbi:hypothetical protein KCU65_g238, partial [Aureobasidium melanogenum]
MVNLPSRALLLACPMRIVPSAKIDMPFLSERVGAYIDSDKQVKHTLSRVCCLCQLGAVSDLAMKLSQKVVDLCIATSLRRMGWRDVSSRPLKAVRMADLWRRALVSPCNMHNIRADKTYGSSKNHVDGQSVFAVSKITTTQSLLVALSKLLGLLSVVLLDGGYGLIADQTAYQLRDVCLLWWHQLRQHSAKEQG